MNILVGCDPEFFLLHNGTPVPSCDLIGGDKGFPILCEGGGYLEDNVAVEINPHPAATADDFYKNIKAVMDSVTTIIKPLALEVDISPVRLFDKKALRHPKAMKSGCKPDYNAWTMRRNKRPNISRSLHRFASGNIHVSWDNPDTNPYVRAEVIKAMDIYLGLAEVVLTEPNERRQFYGKAGSFRPKPYGVEWRTGSNFWLENEDRIRWAFAATVRATSAVLNKEFATGHGDYIQRAINEHNRRLAENLLDSYDVELPGE